MATATSIRQGVEWSERAVELAEANHLDGTATWLGTYTHTEGKPLCWRVPSRDRSGAYTVEVEEWSGIVRCHCTASSYGRPCAHAGSAILAYRTREQAMRPSDPREWQRGYDIYGC